MTPDEEAGLVARVEIPAFICVQWCDECFDAFDAKVAEGHPDPFEGPRERWRANGWTGDAA